MGIAVTPFQNKCLPHRRFSSHPMGSKPDNSFLFCNPSISHPKTLFVCIWQKKRAPPPNRNHTSKEHRIFFLLPPPVFVRVFSSLQTLFHLGRIGDPLSHNSTNHIGAYTYTAFVRRRISTIKQINTWLTNT
mmetsp:Transcript_36241/g.43644  ORF Transcript_36241/g.43644 Transcript_36241/m.43644 type:complete len:132 (-) Transcript_36241:1121-1516(-)